MKVLLLLPYAWNTVPGQRYRIEQWVPHLERLGVTFERDILLTQDEVNRLFWGKSPLAKAIMLAKAIVRRELRLRKLKGVDCVWLYRSIWPIGPAWSEKWLARRGFPIVFDFDDAIWVIKTSDSNRRWAWLKFAGKTADICEVASHVVVGNRFLADYALRFNPHVAIVPPTVDLDVYRLPATAGRYEPHPDRPCVIGWTGSHTTSTYLKLVEPALRILAQRHKILFRVIGEPNYAVEGVPYELVKWNAATEVEDLRPLDIGIMPLLDYDWARGKCGMKAIQYMALGIPTVVSPVGFNTELIRHDENGLMADSVDDWVESLERLIVDFELRRRLGEAGRRTVESGFCATAQAPRVFEVLDAVVRRTQASG